MAEQTVREQLVEALELSCYHHNVRGSDGPCDCSGCRALARHRAEPEEPCTTACDMPTEAHCVGHCPCFEAGHDAGLEAQRERVGGGRA